MAYSSLPLFKSQDSIDIAPSALLDSKLQSQPETLFYPDGFAAAPVIDWLEFTVRADDSDDLLIVKNAVVRYFGGGAALPNGKHGYTSAVAIFGTGRVFWNVNRFDMGVHVSLPSSALSAFAAQYRKPVLELLDYWIDLGVRFTRVDVALDTESVPMDFIIGAYESDQIVTKLQTEQIVEGRRRGVTMGKTLYIGSRSGRRMVRFYDKALEQASRGEQVNRNWVRCEVEFKQEHAQTAIIHLIGGGNPADLIYSTLDFRQNDNERVNRRSRCDWWSAWVASANAVSFPVVKRAAYVACAMAWVINQVAPTLAWVSAYMGNTYWLDNVIEDAAGRVPAFKWDLLPVPEGSVLAGGV